MVARFDRALQVEGRGEGGGAAVQLVPRGTHGVELFTPCGPLQKDDLDSVADGGSNTTVWNCSHLVAHCRRTTWTAWPSAPASWRNSGGGRPSRRCGNVWGAWGIIMRMMDSSTNQPAGWPTNQLSSRCITPPPRLCLPSHPAPPPPPLLACLHPSPSLCPSSPSPSLPAPPPLLSSSALRVHTPASHGGRGGGPGGIPARRAPARRLGNRRRAAGSARPARGAIHAASRGRTGVFWAGPLLKALYMQLLGAVQVSGRRYR